MGPFELYGIFGHPLAHTLSPAMQEAGFRALGRKAFYLPFDLDVKNYRQVLRGRSQLILDGFNVTVPYKEVTARALDRQTPEARAVGAVNTVYRRRGRWVGTNTDVYGFCRALEKDGRFRIAGAHAVVLGAGGAARAVVYGLASKKAARISILNRHPERARRMARDFRKFFPGIDFSVSRLSGEPFRRAFTTARLVVNATSLGLKKTIRRSSRRAGFREPEEKRFFFMIWFIGRRIRPCWWRRKKRAIAPWAGPACCCIRD